MTVSVRSFKAPAIAAVLFAAISAPPAKAADVSIYMDEARLVTLSQPAKTVFTGNALIADATVVDPHHIFISGRNFGVTNLVALDAEGREISNLPVTVMERAANVRVTVQHAGARTTLGCATGRCEAWPTPGDDYNWFKDQQNEIDLRLTSSLKGAEQ
jgi:Flp pilus assembly secretin CpaC